MGVRTILKTHPVLIAFFAPLVLGCATALAPARKTAGQAVSSLAQRALAPDRTGRGASENFAAVIADAAASAKAEGRPASSTAEDLAPTFLPAKISRGPLVFASFRGPRPDGMREPISFGDLGPIDVADDLCANAHDLARHIVGAVRFPAWISFQVEHDRMQLQDALAALEGAQGAEGRREAQRLVAERRAEIAQDLAGAWIAERFAAFFTTEMTRAELETSVALVLREGLAATREAAWAP